MVQVLNGAIGAAASNFAQTAITSKDAHDLLGLLAQASKSGLVGMLSGGANAAATAALSNAMSQLSAKSFGKDAPLAGIFVKGFVSGAGGSVAGMFAEVIVDPSTMSGDWDKVFANAAMGAAQAGLQNGLTEAAQEHHQRGVEVLKSATEAANAKKEAGATIEDQRAAFAKVMSEGYAGLASHEPAPHEQKPEEIQAQREKQQAPDENHAPRDEINGKPVESIKGEMDRVAQKETPPEELQPKEARRGKVDEAAHAADVASVLGGMEAGEVPGKLPHDQIDKNTAEAIKSGAVELITRESLRSMGGDLYMDDHGNVITWKKGTAAQAVGNRVYVDPTVGPEALRMDLRHEVNHALHEADFGSKYDGDSLSRFRDEIRAHSAELGPNPTREQLEIVMSHVMASYPELGARIAEMPPEQLEAIAKQHSQGNTINSVRLMPVYDAIENFHAFDEHPSREKLEEMFGKLDKHDRQALGDDPAFQQWLNQDLALPPAEIEKLWEKLGTGHDELPEPAPSNEKFAQRSGPDEEGLAAKEKRFWEVKTPEPTPESEGTPEEMGPAAERAQARNQREVEAAKSRIEGEELRKAQADYDRKFQQAVDEIRTRTGNHDADDLTADYQAAVKLGDRPEQLTQTEREAVEKRARLEVLNDELGRGVRAKDQEKFQEQRERQELDFKRDASAPEDLDAQVRIHDEELAEKVSKHREENDGAKEFTDEQIEGIVREKQVSSEIAAGEDLKGVKQKMQEALPKLAEKGLLKAVEQLGGAAAKEAVKAHLRTFDHIDGKARPQELGESIAKVVKEGLKAAANLKDPSGKLAEMVEFAFEEGIKARPDIVYKLGEQAIKLKGLVSPEERSFANPENPGRAGDTDERFAKSVADPGVVTPAEAADGRTRRESIKDHEEREAAANELRELTTPPAEASREAQESLGRKQGSVDPVEIAVVHDESSAKLDDLDSRKPDAPRTKTPAEAEPVVAHEELRQPLAAHVDEVPTASAAHEETEPQADAHEEAPKFRVANDEQNQSQQREAEALKDRLTNDEEDHHSAGSFAEDPAEARRQLQVPGPERPIESAIDVNDPRVKAKGELVKAAEARVTAADERVNAALRKGDIDGVRAATGDKRTAQKQLEILAATPAERFT